VRTAYSDNGVPVEFSRDYLRSDRTAIRIKSRAEAISVARRRP
jgi:GntR family transcriptional regulator